MVTTRSLWRRALRVLLCIATVVCVLWGIGALWYQAPQRWLWLVPWSALGVATLLAMAGRMTRLRRRRVLGAGLVAALALLGWWQTVLPMHDRDWADDVARLLHADVDGSRVTLHNVRNFDWTRDGDPAPRWETRTYDLDGLASADLVMSYWMGPAIAHTLVSFGFDDGSRVVFSLEIRKERHESFSAIGGFFKQFEAVLIAADERDIVRVRSNVRDEDVYLYRLAIPREQLRTLFLAYVDEAGTLQQAPRFYNTVTSNCTTIVFDVARHIAPGLPLDIRLLLSGYFGQYAHAHGGLAGQGSFDQLEAAGRITDRARAADRDPDFSRAIRRGVPGIPEAETR
ncbi:DUF4105 domain-containing protein [Luteimonas fraxinea]|uniref:DUF4105 domain-containing protein n=1 Tax=Luteimonas fraxinea TaxID=2901869 RepID=A0ABS8UE04_9GAMM|nr:DUF4105 domain-containing protein [Luteimonas fraxinea]MCD9097716.1 DUF4105 domain-containing protein [Luteimonas fraxinea]MCD9127572.1 DUF4105 domain-containing protein [Luteimonas fraxinea]UHH08612.1 DUF4105 domain-containing protein [Luteimonas fraxinea]